MIPGTVEGRYCVNNMAQGVADQEQKSLVHVSAVLVSYGRGIGGSAVAVILDHQTNSSDGPVEQDVTVPGRRTLPQGTAQR